MGDDQRRFLHILYDLRYRIRLAGTGGTQQHLGFLPVLDSGGKIRNSPGLVAHRLKGRNYLKGRAGRDLHIVEFRHHGHKHAPFPANVGGNMPIMPPAP